MARSRSRLLLALLALSGPTLGGCGSDVLRVDADPTGSTVEYEVHRLEVFDTEGRPVEPADGSHLPKGSSDEELLRDAAG